MRLGREGEQHVGQFLERFRESGFHIFHDFVTGDANIDHVLIGEKGIFVVETKFLSKPTRGQCRIIATEVGVYANGALHDRNPIVQVKAQANWRNNYFGKAGFKVPCQCAVVFPNWFVEPADFKQLGAWVLEPKGLPAFVENKPIKISASDAKALVPYLSNYIRSRSVL